MGAIAVVDAAVFYGAQRIIAGVHSLRCWEYRDRFHKDDDRELFLQFLHFAALYDRLLLDDSSLASAESSTFDQESTKREETLRGFLADVNAAFETEQSPLVESGSFGFSRGGLSKSFDLGLTFFDLYANVARLGAEAVRDPICADRLEALDVPWAYKEGRHVEWLHFQEAAHSVGLDPKWIPQAIFAWRGLWYTELAGSISKERGVSVAYAAAPRRIAVLRELLRDDGRVAALEDRNAAIAAIRKQLPELPIAFDFSDVKKMSPYRSSPIGRAAATREPKAALAAIANIRRTHPDLREWWKEQIFRSTDGDIPVIEHYLPPIIASGFTAGGDITIIVGHSRYEGTKPSGATEPTHQSSADIRIERAKAGKDITASAQADKTKIGISDADAGGSVQATSNKKVALFQVVDRRGTAISGVDVECFEGDTRIATLKSGKRAGRYEPSTGERIRFVARYRGFGPHEGTPDADGMCHIKFPEVDLTPPPIPTPPPDNSGVFNLMTIVAGLFAIIAIVGGVLLVYLGAAGGATEMSVLGATVKTANAGVAAIALGGLVLLFTFRRMLRAIERLSGKS